MGVTFIVVLVLLIAVIVASTINDQSDQLRVRKLDANIEETQGEIGTERKRKRKNKRKRRKHQEIETNETESPQEDESSAHSTSKAIEEELKSFYKEWMSYAVSISKGHFPKKSFNNKKRVIFIAGLDGAGHEQIAELINVCKASSGICHDYPKLTKELMYRNGNQNSNKPKDTGLFVVEDYSRSTILAKKVHSIFNEFSTNSSYSGTYFIGMNNPTSSGYLTYPSLSSKKRPINHPELFTLAVLAEMNNVDLRIVYLHQTFMHLNPTIHLKQQSKESINEERAIVENANALYADLQLIDPAFYTCFPMNKIIDNKDHNENKKYIEELLPHIHPELNKKEKLVDTMLDSLKSKLPTSINDITADLSYYDVHLQARINLLSTFCKN